MSGPSPRQALWHLARVGIAARQSMRLRLALIRMETRERGRIAQRGMLLAGLGLILVVAAILTGLAALAMLLVSQGHTPQTALGIVAAGTAALALLLLGLGRRALRRALTSRP